MHKHYVNLKSHLGTLEESIVDTLDKLCKYKFTKLGLTRELDFGHEVYYVYFGFFSVDINYTGYTLDNFTTFDVDEMCDLVVKRINEVTLLQSNLKQKDEKLYGFLDNMTYELKG